MSIFQCFTRKSDAHNVWKVIFLGCLNEIYKVELTQCFSSSSPSSSNFLYTIIIISIMNIALQRSIAINTTIICLSCLSVKQEMTYRAIFGVSFHSSETSWGLIKEFVLKNSLHNIWVRLWYSYIEGGVPHRAIQLGLSKYRLHNLSNMGVHCCWWNSQSMIGTLYLFDFYCSSMFLAAGASWMEQAIWWSRFNFCYNICLLY